MALTTTRVKMFWGAVDITLTDEAIYPSGSVKALGTTAEAPGIGVRRVQVIWTRAPAGSVEDVCLTTFDYMNMTAGEPDDTWVAADFTALEALLDTFWGAIKSQYDSRIVLSAYKWYRIGPAIPKPNPAVRIVTKSVAGGRTDGWAPPQLAMTITERTGIRRSWGRSYLPAPFLSAATNDNTNGRIISSWMTTVNTAANALYDGAMAADFQPVVYSPTRQKAYGVETLQVDDLWDVQRPRRWDRPLTRLTSTVGP